MQEDGNTGTNFASCHPSPPGWHHFFKPYGQGSHPLQGAAGTTATSDLRGLLVTHGDWYTALLHRWAWVAGPFAQELVPRGPNLIKTSP